MPETHSNKIKTALLNNREIEILKQRLDSMVKEFVIAHRLVTKYEDQEIIHRFLTIESLLVLQEYMEGKIDAYADQLDQLQKETQS